MRCMNCGLPLSPARTQTNCPRCGAPLNTDQGVPQLPFNQGSWGNTGGGGMPQENPWAQVGTTAPPNPFAQQGMQNQMGTGPGRMGGFNGPGLPESPFSPQRPYSPQKKSKNSRNLFMVAGLCVVVGALLLVLIMVLGSTGGNNASPNTARTNSTSTARSASTSTPQAANTPAATSAAGASPTASSSPAANGTAYPGQQYIDGAQMATGVDNNTMQPQQAATTFPVNSNIYVIFNLHPPSTGGEVCSYWYISGDPTPITNYPLAVKPTSHANYIFAIYGSAGQAYVELYWASDASCNDKVLAQHVDFTVTAS
jgi:hypothetical protein